MIRSFLLALLTVASTADAWAQAIPSNEQITQLLAEQ